MIFLNMTETIGIILGNSSTTTTGSLFLTLFIFMLILFAIALIFGIPLELTSVILLPYVIVCATRFQEFVATLVILIFYFTFIFTKRFIFR